MNKLYFGIVFFFFSSVALFAQTGGVSIGKDGEAAHEKAILELVSQSKGLLIPRMTSDQRKAIFGGTDGSAKGLLVFDTVQNAFFFWDGTAWQTVASANAKIVSGVPTVAGVAGELAFDGTNSVLYVYSGSMWVKTGGASGSNINLLPSLGSNGVLYLGTQDGNAAEVDLSSLKVISASEIAVTPNTYIGLSASNVQDALLELQSEITTASSGGMNSVIHDESLTGGGVTGLPLGVASGGIKNTHIADNAVNTNKLVNKSVTTEKLANSSVTDEKLANNAVTNDKLADNAVTTNELANNAVTYNKLQVATGMSRLIGSPSTTTVIGEISLGTGLSMSGTTLNATGIAATGQDVTSSGTITIGNGVGAALTAMTLNLTPNSVTTNYLGNGAVTATKVADNTITPGKLQAGPLNYVLTTTSSGVAWAPSGGGTITDGSITSLKLSGITSAGNSGDVLVSNGSGGFSWSTSGGSGVSSVSVASANGFTGTSSGGTTPALTLGTSVTGLLKGNGTAISAATAGTDYFEPGAGSLTIGSGANAVTIEAPAGNSGAYSLTLPATSGSANYVLKTDGSGVLRWDVDATGTAGGGITSIGLSLPLYNSFTTLTGDGTFYGTLKDQSANTVLAGPTSGTTATPAFRSLTATDIPSLDWSKITTGKPTTLSGYGITDAASSAHTHTFSSLTSKPVTLSGYGITDAQPLDADLTAISGLSGSGYLKYDGSAWSFDSGTGSGTGLSAIDNNTMLGNISGSSAVPSALNASQIKNLLSLSNVENTALSTWSGSSNITTLGNISTGTWNGTTIAPNKGGTGLISYTTGDLIYAAGTNTLGKLSAGTSGYVLTSNGAGVAPSWKAASAGGSGISSAANGLSVNGTDEVILGGSSLDAATTIDQAGYDLTFTTGSSGKTIVNGTIKMTGAVYANFRVATSLPITWANNDFLISVQVAGSQTTLNLPDPATNAGRIVGIRNDSNLTGSGGTYYFGANSPPLNTSILQNRANFYISDGTRWYPFGY